MSIDDAIQQPHPLLPPSPQFFPASGFFLMSWCIASGGPSIGDLASAVVLSVNSLDWFPLGLTGLIYLLSEGTSRVFFSTNSSKTSIPQCLASFMVQILHLYMTVEKIIALTRQTFVSKVVSLLVNTLSRFVIVFLSRSKCLLILWLQSPSTVILKPKKIRSDTVSTFPSSICHEVIGPKAIIFIFWMLSFKPAFSLSSFILIKRLFIPLHFLTLECYHQRIWGCWYFSQHSWLQLVVYPAWHFAWCTLYRN